MNWDTRAMRQKWVMADTPDPALVRSISAAAKLPDRVTAVLVARNLNTAELVEQFLHPKMTDLRDPFDLAGVRMAVERVAHAFY